MGFIYFVDFKFASDDVHIFKAGSLKCNSNDLNLKNCNVY